VTLVSLIRAKMSLEKELPAIVEAILRPLDPSLPSLREGCLQVRGSALVRGGRAGVHCLCGVYVIGLSGGGLGNLHVMRL
jgi:hypothetical protein